MKKKLFIALIVVIPAVWIFAMLTSEKPSYLSWQEVEQSFQDCKVREVSQSSSLEITLEFKAGARSFSKAPSVDSVAKAIESNKEKCGEPIVNITSF